MVEDAQAEGLALRVVPERRRIYRERRSVGGSGRGWIVRERAGAENPCSQLFEEGPYRGSLPQVGLKPKALDNGQEGLDHKDGRSRPRDVGGDVPSALGQHIVDGGNAVRRGLDLNIVYCKRRYM